MPTLAIMLQMLCAGTPSLPGIQGTPAEVVALDADAEARALKHCALCGVEAPPGIMVHAPSLQRLTIPTEVLFPYHCSGAKFCNEAMHGVGGDLDDQFSFDMNR